MFKKINCKEIRDAYIRECENVKAFSNSIHPRLAIIAYDARDDDRAYLDAITKLSMRLGVSLRIRNIISKDQSIFDIFESINDFIKCQIEDGAPILLMGVPRSFAKFMVQIPTNLDIDCWCPANRGKFLAGDEDAHDPITAACVFQVIDQYLFDEDWPRTRTLILGRGKIGNEVAAILRGKGTMVTQVNSQTPKWIIEQQASLSEIIVSCIGKPHVYQLGDFLLGSNDKIVIDVGVSQIDGKLFGDIEIPPAIIEWDVPNRIEYSTVLGGIGSITTARLMHDVFEVAAVKHANE